MVKIKKALSTQLGSGISWNMASLAFLAVAGLVFQALIMIFYDVSVLGYYQEAFAWYVAFSQLAVAGVHFSILKYISQYADDRKKCDEIMTSSLILVVITSVIVIIILYIILNLIAKQHDTLTLQALKNAVPALLFFSLNKVMLNFYNAKSRMKAYAIFQSLRNFLLMAAFIIIALLKLDGVYLTLCFVFSEVVLFIIVAGYSIYKRYIRLSIDSSWFREHLRFGFKIMPSNIVLELNFRTDIICLGMLGVGYAAMGIYAFAVTFAEGFYQIMIVIRRNINPLITQYYLSNNFIALDKMRNSVRKYIRIAVLPASALLVGLYYVVCILMKKPDNLQAVIPLCILLLSMSINSYHTCFGNMLNQIGKPKYETYLNVITLSSNFIFNLALIPFLGIYGATIATALSYFVFSFTLYTLVKKHGDYTLIFIKCS